MAAARRRLACAVIAVAILGFATPAAAAPGEVITIQDESLTGSGSLATDTERGVYWTANSHEASGGVVHAIKPDGSVAGQVRYEAEPGNVEGLSFFDGHLYIGDIGNPSTGRDAVDVYRLESLEYGASVPYTKWTLHYPDGPHDAATMMVSARGNIWIITKGSPGRFYYVSAPGEAGEYTLTHEADGPAWVTDGTFIGPTTAVLRTYTAVMTFDMSDYAVTAQEAAPYQPEGESVTSTLDGQGLLLGSRADNRLLWAPVPTTMQQLPDPPSQPPASTPTPEPQPSQAPGESAAPQTPAPESPPVVRVPTSSKTRAALGIAALISVGAGVLVYFRTRPRTR